MSLIASVVIGVAAAAAVIDLRTRRIPNALTFGAAACALLYHAITGGVPGALYALVGWFVGAAVFFPIFALRGLGAGDVKLLAALGAWLGPVGALYVAAGAAVAGGIVALLVALKAHYLATAIHNLRSAFGQWRVNGIRPVPELTLAQGKGPRLAYAVPIFLGTLGALWLR